MKTVQRAIAGLMAMIVSPLAICDDLRPLSGEESAAFRWFDGLDFGDIAKMPLIEVRVGSDTHAREERPSAHIRMRSDVHSGFLVSESQNELQVLDLILHEVTIPVGADAPMLKRHRDLGEIARATLREAVPRHGWESTDLHHGARVWFLGYACLQKGYPRLARQLFDVCRQDVDGELVTFLKRELSYTAMWRAAVAIGNPWISRKQLVRIHRRFLERYPESQHATRAQETLNLLETMVAEDEEYARRPRKAWNDMSVDERTSDAIFRLRDQVGGQLSAPGVCSIFISNSRSKTPAEQLVAIGPPAVPALIDAIGDKRFSRANEHHRPYYFSERTLRIEDCALQIMSKIIGVSVSRRGRETDEELRTRLKALWKVFVAKGKKQFLIERVVGGFVDAGHVAERLVKEYPGVALEAIRLGVGAARTSRGRSRLVEAAFDIDRRETTDFFREQLSWGEDIATRVAAARGLVRNGKSEDAVAGLLATWQSVGATSAFRAGSRKPVLGERAERALIGFVLEHGDSATVESLAKGVSEHTPVRRAVVVRGLGARARVLVDRRQSKDDSEALVAIERVLLTALTDEGQMRGSVSVNDERFTDPRVCDFAARALASAFPDRYFFDISDERSARDRTLAALRERASAERGE